MVCHHLVVIKYQFNFYNQQMVTKHKHKVITHLRAENEL